MTTDLWQSILDEVKMQTTQATFDTLLSQTRLRAREAERLVIEVPSDQAKDWLENRLNGTIARAVEQMTGESLALEFVVAVPDMEKRQADLGQRFDDTARAIDEWQAKLETPPAEIVDFDYFTSGGGGWVKFAHYIPRFWRPYLGDEPIDIWEYVRARSRDAAVAWTSPLDVRAIELARAIRCSVQKISGVYRPCPEFDRAFFEDGEVLAECCGRHPGAISQAKASKRWPEGRPICRWWRPGALEILIQEGLAVIQKYGSGPRNTFYTIQVYQKAQRLPLLTPAQVGRLPSQLQTLHARFLRKRSLYETWRKIKLFSLLALPVDLTGLELPLPEVGVLSARARKNSILSAGALKTSRNLIFFPDSLCSGERSGIE